MYYLCEEDTQHGTFIEGSDSHLAAIHQLVSDDRAQNNEF
jgi:hypothetical protein